MGVTFHSCVREVSRETQDNIAYSAIHRFRAYLIEACIGKDMADRFEAVSRNELLRKDDEIGFDEFVETELLESAERKGGSAMGAYHLCNCSDSDAVFDTEVAEILGALNVLLNSDIVKDEFDYARLNQMRDVFEDCYERQQDGERAWVDMY